MANLAIKTVKDLVNSNAINQKFQDILGENKKYFMQSVLNAASQNPKLNECDGMSVWGAAMNAAILGLPVDSNLSYSAIVPFKNKAQFQIMTKGYIQLAIDSGLYKSIHVTEVYEDELSYHDSLRGKTYFTEPEDWKQREAGKTNKVIGYFAYFELLNGFSKELYMTKSEVTTHAKKYSRSFNYKDSVWQLNFDSMGKKTVLKNLLRTYGKLGRNSNLDIAINNDQGFVENLDTEKVKYYDNPNSDDDITIIDAETTETFDESDLDDEFKN